MGLGSPPQHPPPPPPPAFPSASLPVLQLCVKDELADPERAGAGPQWKGQDAVSGRPVEIHPLWAKLSGRPPAPGLTLGIWEPLPVLFSLRTGLPGADHSLGVMLGLCWKAPRAWLSLTYSTPASCPIPLLRLSFTSRVLGRVSLDIPRRYRGSQHLLVAICPSTHQGHGTPWWPILGSAAGQPRKGWPGPWSWGSEGKNSARQGPALRVPLLPHPPGSGENAEVNSSARGVKTSESRLCILCCQTTPFHTQDAKVQGLGADWPNCPEPGAATLIYCTALPLTGEARPPKSHSWPQWASLPWVASQPSPSWVLSSRQAPLLSWSLRQPPSHQPCGQWPAPQR